MSSTTKSRTVKFYGEDIVLSDGPQSNDGIDPETWDEVDGLARAVQATPAPDDELGRALMARHSVIASQPVPGLGQRLAARLKTIGKQIALVFITTPIPTGPYIPPSVAVQYSAAMAARLQKESELS